MSRVILVTGANGFVGSAVIRTLSDRTGLTVRGTVRRQPAHSEPAQILVGELGPATDWSMSLHDVDTVIHTAARVHVMKDTAVDPLETFRTVNVEGTLTLARQCVHAGVRRLIYLSSIKVNGEETNPGRPYRASDAPNPLDAYGISKLEAERGLMEIGAAHGLEVVIIRPPLVYGPGVRANFQTMMSFVYRRIPLPFGAVTGNRRSLVALGNLADLIATCIDHPAAVGRVLLVSDAEDLSTAGLLHRLGEALERPARLISVPPAILELGAAALGRRAVAHRLLGSLQVDIDATRLLLNWTPPVSVDDGLRIAARHFLEQRAP